jgi:hypothetical protein
VPYSSQRAFFRKVQPFFANSLTAIVPSQPLNAGERIPNVSSGATSNIIRGPYPAWIACVASRTVHQPGREQKLTHILQAHGADGGYFSARTSFCLCRARVIITMYLKVVSRLFQIRPLFRNTGAPSETMLIGATPNPNQSKEYVQKKQTWD